MACDTRINHRNFYKPEVTTKVIEEVKAEVIVEKEVSVEKIEEKPVKKRVFKRKSKK